MSRRLKKLDGVSALLSLIGFFVSLYYVRDTDIRMWESNMIFSTSPNLIAAADVVSNALFDTCAASNGMIRNNSGPYTMFQLKQEWGNDTYTGTSIAVDTGRVYKPWVMLHWILLCSVLFQGARCLAFTEYDDARPDVLFQYVPSRGPDFWRWVEYALTAPLQIIIILGSFYMRETVLLATMAGLQGALVLLGYVIELELHTVCMLKLGAWQQPYAMKSNMSVVCFLAQCKVIFLLLCAYMCHAIIWAVLIAKFQMQAQAINDCQNPTNMPPEILIVISVECLLFSLFGVVLTWQAANILLAKHLDALTVQALWTNVSGWYSILSVSAKLALEWGFIRLLAYNDARDN